jgi:hypothetical protein
MVFMVTPHDSQDVQNWHNLGAAHNQLRYQTLNNYLKDMRQMTEERYKEWLRVLNTLYQIYPHVLQSQSDKALDTWNSQNKALYQLFQNWPTGIAPQRPIIPPTNPTNNQATGTQLPQAMTTTTSQQQGTQQPSGQQTTKRNP